MTAVFSAPTSAWFDAVFPSPTEVQRRGWETVADGRHALLVAPTGSGKTLAAFLVGIDRCLRLPASAPEGVRVLYVSPLKALAYDVERNLRAPLQGIRQVAQGMGLPTRAVSVDVRTGDTPTLARRTQARHPADILVTTPESLFLLLASRARETLRTVHTVIVDEVHALAPVKRGSHLALSLEWLTELTGADPQRIGLSATVRPLDEVAAWLGGSGRSVAVVDTSQPPALDLRIVQPVPAPAGAEALPERDDLVEAGKHSGDSPLPPGGSILSALYRRGVSGGGPVVAPETRGRQQLIQAALLEEIRNARSSIVFVNSRGLCERLAYQLNELAGEIVAHAHHGSLSRERRIAIEDTLKAGRIRAIVATSSLELGIDMGAVDKVLLVESPGGVARGLQRAGRAGHGVGEVSRALIYPRSRGDLLECAVVAGRMLAGEIESVRLPMNPLDVLAQHLVAWVDARPMEAGALLERCRRAHPFRAFTRPLLDGVLAMLSGFYPAGDFAELRPLLAWDRTRDLLGPRRGAGITARMNAGVIPDRGLYAVYLGEGGPRVGELDEEMVYESRKGDVIQLGASSWRIEEITRDRVLVSPAPGEAGRLPFWRGDAPGRSLELGLALGEFLRHAGRQARAALPDWLRAHAPLDAAAAQDLADYIEEQQRVSALPTDRTLVVERFRDELGDWRVCLLSPFGARVHAPWAIALQQLLSARAGFEVQVLYTDDGIVLRFADTDDLPDLTALLPEAEEVNRLVTDQLPHTALFAGLFRENAARALLMPRRHVQGRRPLWAQRIKAQQLLATVSRHPDFPIVLETYRQALSDLFDMDGLRRVLADIQAGRIRVREVETASASPFARSLVFAYVAAYLYAGDVPLAEKRAHALTLDRRMLSELLGEAELAELLDPQAIHEVEAMLQRLDPEHQAADADALHDLLRTLGDLSTAEIAQRCVAPAGGEAEGWQHWLAALESARRAVQARIAGETRWIAAEDAGLYRDALGVPHPPGLPADCIAPVGDALSRLLRRWIRRHGPFSTEQPARRFGLAAGQVEPVLRLLERDGLLLRGRIRPDAHGDEWVDTEVLKRLKRASLARVRHQAAAQESAALGRFLPRWQGLSTPSPRGPDSDATSSGKGSEFVSQPGTWSIEPPRREAWGPPTAERLLESLLPLEALALPWSTLSLTLLPMRLPGFTPDLLDALAASGILVWVGAGALGPRDGKVMLLSRERAARLLSLTDYDPPTPLHACILERLAARGASFLTELERSVADALPNTNAGDFEAALWDLVWAGRVTNDSFAPLRQWLRGAGRSSGPRRHLYQTLVGGRWSQVADLLFPAASLTEQAVAWAEVLLRRYGIVSQEAIRAEQPAPGWQAIRQAMRAMEESGRLRRGYFVEGLSGVQYARPDALDRLRDVEGRHEVRVLAAVDPANPYGALLPWPEGGQGEARPRRVPGAWVVLVDGRLALYLQPGGRNLLTFAGQLPEPEAQLALALSALAQLPPGGRRHFLVSSVDGVAVQHSPLQALLLQLGFTTEYGGMSPPHQ